MKTTFKFGALAAAAAIAACGGGGDSAGTSPPVATTQAVSIQFAAVSGAGNAPVNCSTTLTGIGSNPVNATLTDLRFYVTDVKLVTAQGTEVPVTLTANSWQQTAASGSVTLIDLENGQFTCGGEGTLETNAVVSGTVPTGTYTKVKATIGVPEVLSHSDVMAAAAPLDIMAMGWSWQAGRKFIKIELNPIGGVSTPLGGGGTTNVPTYNLHLASTDCTGPGNGTDTCAKKNLTQFTLDFNPSTQQIALDIATLFAASDIRTNQSDAVGCMSATSDLDCPVFFDKVGLDIATGGQAVTAQSVFRVIPK